MFTPPYVDAGATAQDIVDGDLTAGIVVANPVDVATPGIYTVTYNVSDAAGNAAEEVTRTVTVVDTTPPVIALLGETEVTVEGGKPYVDADATAEDIVDGDLTAGIAVVNPVDVATPGIYVVTYNVSDAAGNAAEEVSRTVTVVDTTPPEITLVGDAEVTVEGGTPYVDAGATAQDIIDGDLTAGIVVANPVDVATPGTYTVTYNVNDAAGNAAEEVTRTVEVVDTTPPKIALLGDGSVILEGGTPYVDAGATAQDIVDGDLTANIAVVNPVDPFTLDTYTVTYNVSDAAGNAAVEVNRTVTVVDTTPPEITAITPNQTLEGTGPEGAPVSLSVIATDAVDPELLYVWSDNGEELGQGISIAVTLALGEHPVTVTVTDDSGNQTMGTVAVLVRDTTPPELTVPGVDLTVEAQRPDGVPVDEGAIQAFLAEATATDVCDPQPTLVHDAPGDYFPLGVTTVIWTATDVSGNQATGSRTVTVEDTTPPVLTVPADLTVEATGPQTPVDPGQATAIDLVDGTVAVSSDAPATYPVGTTTVTWTTVDAAGNPATGTQQVMVEDTTPPVLTVPGDLTVEATGPRTPVDLGQATATDRVDARVDITNDSPGSFPLGPTVVTWTATDDAGNRASATQTVTVEDTTPPEVRLDGDDRIVLELTTPYAEPGATAWDIVDGDLSESLVITGAVDVTREGTYPLTYQASDASGNPGTATRTIEVVVTPNSYALMAGNSLYLQESARVHTGFAGVVDYGSRPFLAEGVELVVGVRAQTAEAVRVSAPRVRLKNKASIAGMLVFDKLVSIHKKATIGHRQSPGSWPLFADYGLPPFASGLPGTRDIKIKNKKTAVLDPMDGPFGKIQVKSKGTLILTGGVYSIGHLDIGTSALVLCQAPTTLQVDGTFDLDQRSYFGPESSGGDAADILVYVNGTRDRGRSGDDDDDDDDDDDKGGKGKKKDDDDDDKEGKGKKKDDDDDDKEGKGKKKDDDDDDDKGGKGKNDDDDDDDENDGEGGPKDAQVGGESTFVGNLYAPNGTVYLGPQSQMIGSVIGKDVIVGVRAEVFLRSGWKTPGVIYQPPPAPAVKPVQLPGEETGGAVLLGNYPNPFNAETTLYYALTASGYVRLVVYNTLGQQVRVLVDEPQPMGAYSVSWDGRDASGYSVSSGIYFIRLVNRAGAQNRKLLLIR